MRIDNVRDGFAGLDVGEDKSLATLVDEAAGKPASLRAALSSSRVSGRFLLSLSANIRSRCGRIFFGGGWTVPEGSLAVMVRTTNVSSQLMAANRPLMISRTA